MISELVNHLWQSTLFAGVAGLLALALRNNRAHVRYWIWLIASLKFLVPFSAIVVLGSYFAPATTVPAASAGFSGVVTEISQPFVAPSVSFAAVHPTTNPVPGILLALWLCGFLAVVFRWYARWRRIRATVRAARPLALAAGVPVLSSPALLEPGIFGIFRPVLVLPEGIAEHLTREQLNAILAHELCHVRRRDNLFAALHMLVEAIFWFHPLVWWIGARLVEERERACDEEVLRLGNEPEIYAESILKTCRFYLESPLACMSGVMGSDLKKRVVRIMTQRVGQRIGFVGKALLAAAGTLAIAGPLAFGLINALAGAQPADSVTSGSKPRFEVASIKPDKSGRENVNFHFAPGGRIRAENATVKILIQIAYDVKAFQLVGGPKWISSGRYDIDAKPEDSFARSAAKLNSYQRLQRVRLMMQSLLTNRFKLRLSRTTQERPIYALAVAKRGPKIHPASPKSAAEQRRGIRMGRAGNEIDLTDASPTMLADILSRSIGRTVVDETGLKGKYDFTLKWTSDRHELNPFGPQDKEMRPAFEASGPSIFTALREQLGLKLKAEKGPVEVFVIDHVERPSAN